MTTIAEHLRIIRENLDALSSEHAEHGNEFLAIVEAEKAVEEVEKAIRQRIG